MGSGIKCILYHALHIMVGVRVSLKLEASWDFFSRRIERHPKQIVLIHFLEYKKCNFIDRKKTKQTKKPQELVWRFVEKHMKTHGTKVPWPATKEDKCCFFMIAKPFASHSPIDNRGLFIRHQEYKSQVTSYKYRPCSHSLKQSRRQYSFFSRSAKPAGGFKQLHNKRPR